MDEATNRVIEKAENHFVDNILNRIVKTYSNLQPEEYSYDVSSMRVTKLNSLQKVGAVPLPRSDNFFFPQELYLNSDFQEPVLLEYMHMLMPSIATNHFFNGYLYTSTKLASIDVNYEKSNVFLSAERKIRDIIHEDKNYSYPKHLCYMYYANFFDNEYVHTSELTTLNSVKFNLWLHFPVHAEIEKKYINSVKHKLRYPETNGNLVIKVSCVYDLIYEEIMI